MKQISSHLQQEVLLVQKVFIAILSALFALLPFHAFLTVWINSYTSHYRLVQLWKEGLIGTLGILLVIMLWRNYGSKMRLHIKDRLLLLIGGYALLSVGHGTIALMQNKVGLTALLFGLLINLRYLALFSIAYIFFQLHKEGTLYWVRLLMLPAVIVLLFGLAQALVLPPLFLENFGYSKDTILPYQYVDNDPELLRVQSTMRGANPLGAYIVIISTAATVLFMRHRAHRRLLYGGIAFFSMVILFYTYSRSAWIGTVVSVICCIWWAFTHPKNSRKFKLIALAVVLLLGGTAGFIALSIRQNSFVQNAVLHTENGSSSSQSSNSVRAQYIRNGLSDIKEDPEGHGVGTAGPASVWNYRSTPRISENYYIQVAQEIGLVGLALFAAINITVAYRLWQIRRNPLAVALLASLIGISIINMLLHGWADDTVALLWWGYAGFSLGLYWSANDQSSKHTAVKQE